MELLDPRGDLFGGRIIASSATTEDGTPADQAKSLMQARSLPGEQPAGLSCRAAVLLPFAPVPPGNGGIVAAPMQF